MAKRTTKKRRIRRTSRVTSNTRNIIIGILILLLILFAFGLTRSAKGYKVLGLSTFLARGGDDGGGSGGGDDHGGGGGGGGSSSGGSSSGSSGGSSGQSHGGSGGSDDGQTREGFTKTSSDNSTQPQGINPTSKVDCVGPDGNTFQASFKDCQKLNSKWGKSNFQFKQVNVIQQSNTSPLKTEQKVSDINPVENEIHKIENEVKPIEKNIAKVEVEAQDKVKIDLRQAGVRLRIEKEGDKTTIKVKNTDGTEHELNEKEFEDVNKKLENENETEVETASASGGLVLKHKGVEAETENTIERDLSKNTLTIVTPKGIKTLDVLPDQAVANALIRNVLSQTASGSAGFGRIKLTVKNEEPVFEIPGVKKKKVFGLIPVSLGRSVDVSATTGEVTGINESILTRILDSLSF